MKTTATCRELAPIQIGAHHPSDAGPSVDTKRDQSAPKRMTRDTLSMMVGDLQLRNRTNSLAAPVYCDLYRRSLSEGPEEPVWPRHDVTRSHSVKVRKTRPIPEIETALPRWYCYRVRSFHMSSRGVINRGDSLRYKQARRKDQLPTSDHDKQGQENDAEKFCVQILGATGVGKTALGNQFLTSEHMFVRSNLPEVSCGERSVTVLLNGQESQLTFIDGTKQGDEDVGITPDGFLVIYSVTNTDSFEYAKKTLQDLRPRAANKAIILVANKSDLMRTRCVSSQDGRTLASSFNVKYIETSVGINHNVDELLVGALAQIRLKQKGRGKVVWPPSFQKASFRVRRIFRRIIGKDEPPAPCDILHSL